MAIQTLIVKDFPSVVRFSQSCMVCRTKFPARKQCEVNAVELGFYSLGFCRFEYATHDQLPLAVDEGVGHFLLAREPVGSLQWLDPKSTGKCPH